uniref:Uncharacterized protein n=1 Tax=Marmota marmota marmota TaxID=9994 RepID=A0A8C5ZTT1_MARMA
MGKPTSADLKLGLATGPVLFACQQFPEMNAMIMRRFSLPGDVDRARQYVLQVRLFLQGKRQHQIQCGTALHRTNHVTLMKSYISDTRPSLSFDLIETGKETLVVHYFHLSPIILLEYFNWSQVQCAH